MANKADSDSKGCGKGAGKGQGKGDGQGDSKSGKDGSKAKKLADSKKGDSDKGTGKDGQADGDGDKIAEAARNAELAAQILKALEEQAGAKGSKGTKPGDDAKGEGQASGGKGLSAAELAALRKRIDIEQLAKDLKALAEGKGDRAGAGSEGDGVGDQGRPGGATSARDAKGSEADVAARLEKMAKELRAEAGRLNTSRLAQLAELREKAKALRDVAMAEEAAEDRRLIAQAQANGAKPGQKITINGGTLLIPSKPIEAPATRGGDADGTTTGIANKAGDVARVVVEAKRLGDEVVHGSAMLLEQQVPPLPPLMAMIKRLDTMIAELPGGGIPQTAQTRVPEAHRREIEAYTRNLSDDLGNDSK